MAEWFVPRPWVVALTPVNRKFVVIFWTTTAMVQWIFWMKTVIAWTGKPVIVARAILESVNMVPRPVRTATGANALARSNPSLNFVMVWTMIAMARLTRTLLLLATLARSEKESAKSAARSFAVRTV